MTANRQGVLDRHIGLCSDDCKYSKYCRLCTIAYISTSGVVLTVTRIARSMVTGQTPVVLECKNIEEKISKLQVVCTRIS